MFSKPAFNARRFRQLWPTYLIDWGCCAVFLIASLCLELVMPFRRHFSVTDKEISFPYTEHETVSSVALVVIAFVVPLVLLVAINQVARRGLFDLHQSVLGLGLAITLTTIFTEIAKITIGRPRPDFLSRCKPTVDQDPPFSLSTTEVCTWTSNYIKLDAMRSFMSGHTSSCFAGLGFLTFYLAGKMHIFDERGFVFKPLVCVLPLIGAALVGISRIDDYRHHWQDVLTGAGVGLFMAFFSYRQYFPSLSSPVCHRPFSPRIPSETLLEDIEREDSMEPRNESGKGDPTEVVVEPSEPASTSQPNTMPGV
ncbi:phosphatidic acid phosphatase type 2/haloperoxidase [Thamnocephalis sphaerospora]|uniref:Phosphatidic acid phosphatase type 2/haloperoxidase n=1 Tax=Thamnocephalis sphaerospora TaxID=78915 RepID=A0A4P9XSH9_9FUNG|nr:phosphatidic acid phosphatase type 2/haloperoxidase [Thamnocephalis sphaerospora]|eukprot:RKP08942.1 phosphatidic acid phosphatase type 2/haloperoxidase [Thamnocephalis sphaerospora]